MLMRDLRRKSIIPVKARKKISFIPGAVIFASLLFLTVYTGDELAQRASFFEFYEGSPVIEKRVEVRKLPYFEREEVNLGQIEKEFDSLSVPSKAILEYLEATLSRPVISDKSKERIDTILIKSAKNLKRVSSDSLLTVSTVRSAIENLVVELGLDSLEGAAILRAVSPVLKSNISFAGYVVDTVASLEGISRETRLKPKKERILLAIYILIVFVISYFLFYSIFRRALDTRKIVVLVLGFLIMLFFEWVVPLKDHGLALFAFPFVFLLVGFFNGFHQAIFFFVASTIIFLPLFRDNLIPVLFLNSVVGLFSSYIGTRIKTRWDFLLIFLFLSLVSFGTILLLSAFTYIPWFPNLKFTTGVLGVSVLLLIVVVPLLEKILRYPTDFVLLELANVNHPLLLKLQDEAPGTFEHSLRVSEMGARVAPLIGINPLLARVAGLYHDIGKLMHSIFFVENLRGGANPHDKVSPEMSVQILKSHVIDGVNMGRNYRLPEEIIGVISSHHGTSVMYSIYKKAQKMYKDVDKDKYRYPGPRPRNRLEALFMIIDGIEAASRALENKSESKFREIVNDIVDEKIKDGQFLECDISYSDLEKMKEEILKILLSQHHLRIKYHEDKGY